MNKKPYPTKAKTTPHERLMEEFSREMFRIFPSLNFELEGNGEDARFASANTYLMFAAYQAALRGPSAFKPGCYALAQICDGKMYLVGELTTDFKKIVADQKRLNRETGLLHLILTSTEGSLDFMLSKMNNHEMPTIAGVCGLELPTGNSEDQSENSSSSSTPMAFREVLEISFDRFALINYPDVVFPKEAESKVADVLVFAANLSREAKQKLVYGCFKHLFEDSLRLNSLRTLVFFDDGEVKRSPGAVSLAALNQTGQADTGAQLATALFHYLEKVALPTNSLQIDLETAGWLLEDFFAQTNKETNPLTGERAVESFKAVLETITGVQIFSQSELSRMAGDFIDFVFVENNED